MNDAEKEYCLQVFCGIALLFFVILIMRELDKGHKWEPMNTPPKPPEAEWPSDGDSIADDTPLDGYGYGTAEDDPKPTYGIGPI